MPIEADPIWREVAQALPRFVSRSLSWGAKPSGEGKPPPLSLPGGERNLRRAHPVPEAAGRAPQVLPPGGGVRSDAPDGEKEFETAGFFIFGGLSLVMAILKLAVFSDWS